jgi:hypothetical protein
MAPLALSVKSDDDDYVVTCPRCMAEVHVQPEGITFRVGGQPADKPRRTATFACVGPIDPATKRPAEACGKAATKQFFFPHRDGVAFIFACEGHATSLGQWATRQFGGCFWGGIDKVPGAMKEAATKFARVDMPHGEEFDTLVRVPGSPKGRAVGGAISRN